MSSSAVISLIVSITGLLLGILWKVIDMSITLGRLYKTVENNEKRQCEERENNSKKFQELYSYRNTHDRLLALNDAKLQNLVNELDKIDKKLDTLINRLT